MTLRRALLIFFGGFLLSLLLTAPSWLLLDRLQLPDEVRMAPAQGNLWRGSVPWLDVAGVRLSELRWRLRPAGFLQSTPLRLSAQYPLRIDAALGSDGERLILREAQVQSTLSNLLAVVQAFDPGLEADIELQVVEGIFTDRGCEQLDGSVRMNGWRGDVDGLDTVGPLTGTLSCQNGNIRLEVDRDNRIRLQGFVVVDMQGRYQLDLRAMPPRGPVYDLMSSLFGSPRGGVFTLRLRS